MRKRKEDECEGGVYAHLIIIVSSISSTPLRNRFAKTGGTERTIDAFTEPNSSFSFPLRALLGEISTSTGGGEPFRFMSGRDEPVSSARCIGTGRSGIPAHAVTRSAVDFGAHSIPSPSSTLQGTFERGTVWYVSYLAFMAHQTYGISISLVRPKNYYTNPHHGDSNIWEGTAGGRATSC